MIAARRCALCGRPDSSPAQGGIAPYTVMYRLAVEAGVPLKAPESRYFHVSCVRRVQRLIAQKRTV